MRYLNLAALEKASPPPAALAINSWERDRLTALRTRVVEGVKQSLDTLPADQRKAALAKLEQLGSSADLQMYKVKIAVGRQAIRRGAQSPGGIGGQSAER